MSGVFRRGRTALGLVLCVGALAASGQTQVTIIQTPQGATIVQGAEDLVEIGGDEPMAQEAPAAPDEPKSPTGAPGPRLDKLKRLEFDRRPSAILAAWSQPPVEEPATEEAAEEAVTKEKAGETAPKPDEKPEAPLDEAAAKKKAAAEAAAKKKAEAEAKKKAEAKALEAELKLFQRNVTLGEWTAVKSYLASLTEAEKKVAYDRLLQHLLQGPQQRPNVPPQGQQYLEKNRFSPADVLGMAQAAPLAISKENLEKLGKILRLALDAGHQVEDFLVATRPELEATGSRLDRRALARLLVAADETWFTGEFLPTPEDAEVGGDREGLNLIARHRLACFEKDQKTSWLVDAWHATQAVLAEGEVPRDVKMEALTRAVDIAPKVQKELGQAWLDESFATRPERGMEILGAIGTAASTALAAMPMDFAKRQKLLELQTTAANTLLRVAPERADAWGDSLELLAANWLKEALFSYQFDDSTSLGPRMQRDAYGNVYWYENQRFGNNAPKAIRTGELLSIRPSDAWLSHLQATLRPRFSMVLAQLYLKVGEDRLAFPFIETLAATHERQAEDLAAEFLRVWTKNHDPNTDRNRSNRYVFMYGFDERANSIPVTRSKQDRNLADLREWNQRLAKAGIHLDPDQLSGSFMQVHSQAEVYRLETIEEIFGPLKTLEPEMLGALLERMRVNLATVWRDPAVQDDKKTKRRQKDIEAEVLAGYARGTATITAALAQHPDDWRLLLAQAAFAHDENDYRQSLQKDPEYSARRAAAFAGFARAAQAYAAVSSSLEVDKETTRAYETWFYAALGACDLKAIDHSKVLAAGQIERIRAALLALPADRAERHMASFVNALVTRVGSVSPAVKFRYVREGLAIVGDHERAREIRDVYEYYQDLTHEIQLTAHLEGGEQVGHDKPFGLQIDLRHTTEIERESGGFGKYLQNQNAQRFAYNYGRPLEDYRDKFETATRETLAEHFEVVSVTFNEPTARSHATEAEGWRRTPYAYVLLKAKGPEVDRVPALRLDLDFLDTSGYAVVPVESAPVVIDARTEAADARPVELLTLTQTLDERQAKDGRLILDVKTTGHGLPPALAELLDLSPQGFDVERTNDHGSSVVKFDEDGDAILAERSWTLTLRAKEGLAARPRSFEFGKPKLAVPTTEQFRYVDADLASVGPVVDLEADWGSPRRVWPWLVLMALVVGVGAWLLLRRRVRSTVGVPARFEVPENVTPFTVLGLLRRIENEDGLTTADHTAIASDIERIESHYFGEEPDASPNLAAVAERWVAATTVRAPAGH